MEATPPRARLALENVWLAYGEHVALAGVSLDVPGGVLALLGPSGSGKSTALRVIAGLAVPDSGRVLWEGRSLAGVPPERRRFGLMFQDYALFPHLSVVENVAFGPRMAGEERHAATDAAREMLRLVDLEALADRDVAHLSGGEQQRVALARALAPRPRLLMLDEPLGSLDRTLREDLLATLGRVLRQLEQTTIFVTHDQDDAFAIADTLAVMRAGAIVAAGPPEALYGRPGSAWLARFLGLENVLAGHVDSARVVETDVGPLALAPEEPQPPEGSVLVLLRPDALAVEAWQPGAPGLGPATVVARSFRGAEVRLTVELGNTRLVVLAPFGAAGWPLGAQVALVPDRARAVQIVRADDDEA